MGTKRHWFLGLLLLALMTPLFSGCFIKSMMVDSFADSLAAPGDTFSSDNDPELIRQAVPFSLKLMESILSATPRHVPLLTALSKSFTEYAYAFVHSDGEYIADKDYPRSQELKERAKKLYIRARDYGLRGFDVRYEHFSDLLLKDPKAAVALAKKEDIDLLYWTGVSWLAAISLSKDDPELVSDVPQGEALIYRAYELEPDYDDGSLHEFLITYEGSRPALMGGSLKKAKEHFEAALKLNGGLSASTYVNYAAAVDEKEQDREEFIEMCNKALAIDVDKKPSWRLVNLITQKRAKWLLSHVDTLFVK
ncbi:MAG TPA: TRAP transporter TatT component family protein [bacterium]|nr:TRAP transporter TatT component family protein [bacterium]